MKNLILVLCIAMVGQVCGQHEKYKDIEKGLNRGKTEFYFDNLAYSNDLRMFYQFRDFGAYIDFDQTTRIEFISLINKYFDWRKKAKKMNTTLEEKKMGQINVAVGFYDFASKKWYSSKDKSGQIIAEMNFNNSDYDNIRFVVSSYKFSNKTNITMPTWSFAVDEDYLLGLKDDISDKRIKKWRDSFK